MYVQILQVSGQYQGFEDIRAKGTRNRLALRQDVRATHQISYLSLNDRTTV